MKKISWINIFIIIFVFSCSSHRSPAPITGINSTIITPGNTTTISVINTVIANTFTATHTIMATLTPSLTRTNTNVPAVQTQNAADTQTAVVIIQMTATVSVPVYKKNIGTTGYNDGQIRFPYDVTVDNNDNIYVADFLNRNVLKYSSTGIYIMSLGIGLNEFVNPTRVEVDKYGNIYVYDNGIIKKYSSSGVFVSDVADSTTSSSAFAVFQDYLYIVNSAAGRFRKYTLNGVLLSDLDIYGAANDQLQYARVIDVDTAGSIYLLCGEFIHKYSDAGILLSSFHIFNYWTAIDVTDLFVASDGSIYLTDKGTNMVYKYSNTGSVITYWGSAGSANDQFSAPRGVAVNTLGEIFVADSINGKVKVFGY